MGNRVEATAKDRLLSSRVDRGSAGGLSAVDRQEIRWQPAQTLKAVTGRAAMAHRRVAASLTRQDEDEGWSKRNSVRLAVRIGTAILIVVVALIVLAVFMTAVEDALDGPG